MQEWRKLTAQFYMGGLKRAWTMDGVKMGALFSKSWHSARIF